MYIAVSTIENCILVMDSFSGEMKNKFTQFTNDVTDIIKGSAIDISFTNDSLFLASGSEDGQIHIWDIESQ